MEQIIKSFTEAGISDVLQLGTGETALCSVSGTYTGDVRLERSDNRAQWQPILPLPESARNDTSAPLWLRFQALGAITGQADSNISRVGNVIREVRDHNAAVVEQITDVVHNVVGFVEIDRVARTITIPGLCTLDLENAEIRLAEKVVLKDSAGNQLLPAE
jgi:hypothetical protein